MAERGAHSALRREPPREDHERARRGRGERLAGLAELQTESRQRLGTLAPGYKRSLFRAAGFTYRTWPIEAELGWSRYPGSVNRYSNRVIKIRELKYAHSLYCNACQNTMVLEYPPSPSPSRFCLFVCFSKPRPAPAVRARVANTRTAALRGLRSARSQAASELDHTESQLSSADHSSGGASLTVGW